MAGVDLGAGHLHAPLDPSNLKSINGLPRFILPIVLAAASCAPTQGESALNSAADSARADSVNRVRQDSINRATPGYVVDSILPVEEEIRRFRTAIGGQPVSELNSASASREELVRRFMKALTASDSAELRSMVLNAREFGDLVYPESPYTHPPYRQSPALVWNQIQNPSASGFTRLVRRLGSQPLRYLDHKCDPKPDRNGRNLIWTNCFVRVTSPNGDTTSHRLFGSVIQRDGRFKIVSYKNEF